MNKPRSHHPAEEPIADEQMVANLLEYGTAEGPGGTPSPAPQERRAISTDILNELLIFSLRNAHKVLWRQFQAGTADLNIRPTTFNTLILVGANPGIAQIELAGHAGVDKAAMSTCIDDLEARQWVERKRCSWDRRRHGIFLTPAGSQVLQRVKREALSINHALDANDRRRLLTLLQKINARSDATQTPQLKRARG